MDHPAMTCGSPSMRQRCTPGMYQFVRVDGDQNNVETFERLLCDTYDKLGFSIDKTRATGGAERYISRCCGQTASICALQPAQAGNAVAELVRAELGHSDQARYLELKNVVVAPAFRGSIALGLMLYECAKRAHAQGYDALIGLTRKQTLRYFVDYGVSPIDHSPLHALGNPALLDYAIYFDTQSASSVAYMHERSRRYFHQVRVMNAIRDRRAASPVQSTWGEGADERVAHIGL